MDGPSSLSAVTSKCRIFFWRNSPHWAKVYSFTRFLHHTNDAPQSVGLLWTSDQLVAETSTWQHSQHSQQTNIHAPAGIRTNDLSRRAAAEPRLRPRGHWGRPQETTLKDLYESSTLKTTECSILSPPWTIHYTPKNIPVLLQSLFWVIPRDLNFICRRFGTLYAVFVGSVSRKNKRDEILYSLFFLLTPPTKMEQGVPKRRHVTSRRRENYPKERIQHSEHGKILKSWIHVRITTVST